MSLKFVILTVLILFSAEEIISQDVNKDSLMFANGICTKNGFCIPSLEGLPRPKGLEVTYARVSGYDLNTQYQGSEEEFITNVNTNRRVNYKLKLPIVLKDELNVILGFNYEREEFEFLENVNFNNPFQNYLNDRDLISVGTNALIIKPLIGNRYLVTRLNLRFSGDFNERSYSNQARGSATVLYGKKVSRNLTWGAGLSYNNSFGRQAIFPVLAYNRKFTDKWSLDLILPVSAKLQYLPNDKNTLVFSTKITGDKYYVKVSEHDPSNLFFEKASLNLELTYERELFDFIWLSLAVGNRTNINFQLFDKNNFLERSTPLITSDLGNAFYAEAGIFLVPPRAWLDKNRTKQH